MPILYKRIELMEISERYQTPPAVCRYMASLIPEGVITVLEPTKGLGNIVKELSPWYEVTAPDDYFLMHKQHFDSIVMNPPFSAASAILDNAPASYQDVKGMKVGYRITLDCMEMSDVVIALVPWFTLTDSDVRMRYFKSFGLKSITSLPRKTFEYARIQTCVLELNKGYAGPTEFKVFDLLPAISDKKELLIAI